jgi:simple sugar transport system permease protein
MISPLGRHETALLLLLIALVGLTGVANPAFFSSGNLLDLLKSSATMGLFALGVLVVLISGGIDVSFPAIAAFCLYVVTLMVRGNAGLDHLPIVLAMAAGLGAALGCLNGALVHLFGLPALIVTLGTASLIRGALLAFVGTRVVTDLPSSMVAFSRATFSGLAASFVVFVGLSVGVALLLARTTLGRGIYALGGAPEAARRAGLPIARLRLFVYGFMGAIAGLVGIFHASQMRVANPFDITGVELTVIAAVVLGGASLAGGKGTVIGTVLGVLILVLIENSLVLVGLPSEWHKVVLGSIMLVSVGLPALRSRQRLHELRA